MNVRTKFEVRSFKKGTMITVLYRVGNVLTFTKFSSQL